MAKAASTSMDKGELKHLLAISKSGPINFAAGVGEDPKAAALLLDKRLPGKTIGKTLTDASVKSIVFGTAEVKADIDPKLVIFTCNKAVGGMAKRLAFALKGTGFSKVSIRLDDGTEVEGVSEPDETPGAPQDASADAGVLGAASAAGAAAAAAAASPFEQPVAPPSPPSEPAAPTAEPAATAPSPQQGDDTAPGQDAWGESEPTPAASAAPPPADPWGAPPDPWGAPQDASAPATDAPADAASEAEPAMPPAAPASSDADVPYAGALTKQLADLLKRIPGAIAQDPSSRDALVKAAQVARDAVKAGNVAAAQKTFDELEQQLDAVESGQSAADAVGAAAGQAAGDVLGAASGDPSGVADGAAIGAAAGVAAGAAADVASAAGSAGAAAAAAPQPAPAPTAPRKPPAPVEQVHKSGLAWTATRGKLDAEIKKLHSAILKACDGEDMFSGIEKAFTDRVTPVLGNLDDSLNAVVDQIKSASDPASRQSLIDQAQKIIGQYQAFVAQDAVIKKLDSNPFMPLALAKTVTATLTALSSAIH